MSDVSNVNARDRRASPVVAAAEAGVVSAAPAAGRPTVCLCMIVKNEARVIERCLASVRGIIDTWVISDTGSTDGTQDLIRNCLAGIPGELHEDAWFNFGHNRSLNVRHARGKADYLLLIDADMVVQVEGALPILDADAYMLRHLGQMEYRNTRLVRGSVPWRYLGATHEVITSDAPTVRRNLDVWAVEHFADGGSRSDKFERDERLLSEEVAKDPGNTRAVFYLAQTVRDRGDVPRAVELYERRAAMGGWGEEVYYALLQVGVLCADAGDWPRAMDAFVRAWESRPTRMEACYELASRLRLQRKYQAAHAVVKATLGTPMPDDVLFLSPWVYRWGLLFEYSISAYWVGDRVGALRACDELLAREDLPPSYRQQTVENRKFCV